MASMKLLDLPIEPTQQGTQRCYLTVATLKHLGLTVGEWVTVKCGNQLHVCTVWPCSDLPSQCLQLDKCVTVKELDDKSTGGVQLDHVSLDCIEIVDQVKSLDSVTVTVLVDSGQVMPDLKRGVLNRYVQPLIVGLGVVKQCRVQWPRRHRTNGCPPISSLLIEECTFVEDTGKKQHSTELKSSCIRRVGVTTPKTVVSIVQIANEDAATNLAPSAARIKIAGLDEVVTMLTKLIKYPTEYPNSLEALQLNQSKGILLHGPTGVGKTSLVHHVARECNTFLVQITGPDVFGGSPGESETNLRAAFDKAKAIAESGQRCVIIFIDELDILCPKRGVSGGTHESRIVAQLLLLMDEMRPYKGVVVIGATSRPNVIDPALRRPGRFDQEVIIGMPNTQQRLHILQAHTDALSISSDVDFSSLAKSTNGFSGADIACLCREAVFHSLSEMLSEDDEAKHKPELHMSNFLSALSRITPSLQRSASCITELEPVSWESIGGLQEIKQKLKQVIQWPLEHWDAFSRLGIDGPQGVLLYGPPGCCKTTLARAAASSGRVAFLSVNCAQLYSPFVGDSEKIIADLFHRARMSAPSVIFLDELDSIVGGRSSDKTRSLSERILSSLLNEMDGIGTSPGERMQTATEDSQFAPSPKVLVLAATNRVELVDAALLRPGRLDNLIYVPHPDYQARLDILLVHTKDIPLSADVDLGSIAKKTDYYTGADLEAVCREAALLALQQDGLDTKLVYHRHFIGALEICKASLNQHLIEKYSKT